MTTLRYNDNLTLLYNDTKQKALINVGKQDPAPASSYHRKLRAQKDRLVTWGLEWSEESSDSIDENVARAGLTETVSSVLGNIREVLEQADRISSGPQGSDKLVANQDRYRDLLKDLTTSIDTLYDLSTSRRAIARGTHPTFGGYPHEAAKHGLHNIKVPFDAASFASSELTLVNTSFTRPTHSPYVGLPASINPQALLLPVEAPPPYENLGIPATARMMGQLNVAMAPESIQTVFKGVSNEYVSVLVEFANYDSLYRDTGVPPPLLRVQRLASALNNTASRGSLRLLGYFEDPQQPRIGLVFDHRTVTGAQADDVQPVTLLSLILRASKATRPVDISNATPFLEDRFRIALRIVERLRDLHVENYFHGNLHSESIAFLQEGHFSQMRKAELHRPTISSFDIFARDRVERVNTSAAFNITRHPDDDGGELEDDVTAVRYDLYGLGLILMEIGLWSPLNDFFKQKYSLKDFKLRLEKLYIPKLASKCGSLYLRVVQTCLRWSDNEDVGHVGVDTVYESIILKLRRCCLLDEDEPLEFTRVPIEFLQEQDQSVAPKSAKKKRNLSPSGHSMPKHYLDGKAAEKASLASLSGLSESTGPPPRSPILSMLSAKGYKPNLHDTESVKSTLHSESHGRVSEDAGTTRTSSVTPSNIRHVSQPSSDALPYPFREYRRKVMLIQSCWRERRRQKAERRRSFVEESPKLPVQADHRIAPPTNRCCIFPIKLPQAVIDQWHCDIGLRLSCIVERALKGSPESSSIDLVNLGHDPISAKPTIVVTCNNTARVKAALKRKFNYDKSMFDLKVRQGRVSLSKGKARTSHEGAARRSGDSESEQHTPMNPFWQERPLCGASIGAYLPEHGHLEPVTFGGIIEIDDKQYGMSVHHMFDPPDDSDCEGSSRSDNASTQSGAARSSARDIGRCPLDQSHDERVYMSDLSSVSGSEDEEGYISSDFESDVSDREDQGDRPGIKFNSRNPVQVTQPAFDDAIAEDLHADDATTEELDEDHLASYKLGNVYASSGLRRWNKDGQRFEIDWALLELEPPRLQPYNLIQGGRRHCKTPPIFCPDLKPPICRQQTYTADEDWYPTDIVPADGLANLPVHCIGRTSGLKTGTIGAAMSFVKISGRRNFSLSWSVIGEFGVGGDSGAWIISNTTGSVAGHVLAERKGLTYICSMSILFEDMRNTLGAKRIALPGPRNGKHGVAKVVALRGKETWKKAEKERLEELDIGVEKDGMIAGREKFQKEFGGVLAERVKANATGVAARGRCAQSVGN